jgi:hypothetical protein
VHRCFFFFHSVLVNFQPIFQKERNMVPLLTPWEGGGLEKCIWELMHSIKILGEKSVISGAKSFNFRSGS